ncbi:MAG: HAD-IA family hydrolase [Candidatus Nanopelagicales bacterium]|jgi:sugar-phosphatase|nr:HAD-IA family hydrolase [Candidatus Nanopelagicales bacterium]
MPDDRPDPARPPLPVRAVLLDMDGTLVDSHAAVERAWRTWAAAWGADADATLAVSPGRPADQTIREALPGLSDDEVSRAAADQLALQYDDLADLVALPGTAALLATLDELGLPWAVVTSADPPLAAARLGAVGIDAPVLVTCQDVPVGKPDPAPYLHAAALLGVPPGQCLVVEDAPAGVAAGRAAGMPVAGVHGAVGDLPTATLADVARWLRAAT